MAEQKPIKAKPNFYACVFHGLKETALKFGYNLVLHGSMDRDFDLIAIPWVDDPQDEFLMIQEMDRQLNNIYCEEKSHYLFSVLPGQRKSYVINMNRGGRWNNYLDEQWYIDISVTPINKG